ncbi:MAG: hypothetical protein M3Q64_01360 [bacterium]|nr:hypothetical protein [bacterium]
MILFINTVDFNSAQFAIIEKDSVQEVMQTMAFNESYKTNELLQIFLKKQKVNFKDITKIIVCSGPGSFTGIRVGVSMAQAMGFALGIPVIAIPRNKAPVDLLKLATIKLPEKLTIHYGQKPKITKSKK